MRISAPHLLLLLVAVTLCGLAGRCLADGSSASTAAEPSRALCLAAVESARNLAATLPKDDGSRHFAERYLEQALMEAGGGEFDECVEYAARANEEVKHLYHSPAAQRQVPSKE